MDYVIVDAASQPISTTSLVNFSTNYTMFVSSTVLHETHTSLRSTFKPFSTRKTLINALSSEVSTGTFTQMTQLWSSPFLVTLQRIFNTRLKICRLLFSAIISEHYSKNRMILYVVAAKIWYLKNVRFLLGHPVFVIT